MRRSGGRPRRGPPHRAAGRGAAPARSGRRPATRSRVACRVEGPASRGRRDRPERPEVAPGGLDLDPDDDRPSAGVGPSATPGGPRLVGPDPARRLVARRPDEGRDDGEADGSVPRPCRPAIRSRAGRLERHPGALERRRGPVARRSTGDASVAVGGREQPADGERRRSPRSPAGRPRSPARAKRRQPPDREGDDEDEDEVEELDRVGDDERETRLREQEVVDDERPSAVASAGHGPAEPSPTIDDGHQIDRRGVRDVGPGSRGRR